MKAVVRVLLILLALLAAAPLAFAPPKDKGGGDDTGDSGTKCDLSITSLASTQTWTASGGGGYQVYDPVEQTQTIQVGVTNAGKGTCTVFVSISAGNSGVFTQRVMRQSATDLGYNLYTDAAKSNIIKDAATATSSEVLVETVKKNETKVVDAYWMVAPSQILPPFSGAYYDDDLVFSLYLGRIGHSPTHIEDRSVRLQSQVASSVELSLVDTGASFDEADATQLLSFGVMSAGSSLGFDLRVRTNDGYRVSMQSDNAGVMAHVIPVVTSTAPYSITVDGSAADLSSGSSVEVATGTGSTDAEGDALPIVVTIGDVADSTAGDYQDVITISVAAN
jgi:spore coat protein U-like protein